MSADWSTDIPFLPGEETEEERRRKQIILAGAAINGINGMNGMNGMDSFMGPVYPLLLDPADGEEEKDPNP